MYIYRNSDNVLMNILNVPNYALINCATAYNKSQNKIFIAGG